VPLYEYECRKCHHRFEEIQKHTDKPIRRCRKCKTGRVQRLISAPAVQFKGTGWYVTDYAGKGKSERRDKEDKGGTGDKGGAGDKDGKSDKGAKEGKSDSGRKSSDKD
jgi:putative FmdB family regulatory protein